MISERVNSSCCQQSLFVVRCFRWCTFSWTWERLLDTFLLSVPRRCISPVSFWAWNLLTLAAQTSVSPFVPLWVASHSHPSLASPKAWQSSNSVPVFQWCVTGFVTKYAERLVAQKGAHLIQLFLHEKSISRWAKKYIYYSERDKKKKKEATTTFWSAYTVKFPSCVFDLVMSSYFSPLFCQAMPTSPTSIQHQQNALLHHTVFFN